MDDKLDEGLADEPAKVAHGSDEVDDGQKRESKGDGEDDGHLGHQAAASEAGQAVIPQRRQELLVVWVRHELHT